MIRSGPIKQGTTRWTMQHAGGPRYLLVEAGAKILVLENSEERCERSVSWMPNCVICRTVSEAIEAFSSGPFDWIFVDRDLGRDNRRSVLTEKAVLKRWALIGGNVKLNAYSTSGSSPTRKNEPDFVAENHFTLYLLYSRSVTESSQA
jgi:hypothetical protein